MRAYRQNQQGVIHDLEKIELACKPDSGRIADGLGLRQRKLVNKHQHDHNHFFLQRYEHSLDTVQLQRNHAQQHRRLHQ